MKKVLVGIAALVVAAPLVASAQTPRPSDRPASGRDATTTKQSDARPVWKAEGAVVDSSDIVGTKVRDAQGKDIGEIDRLIIDPQSGRISHVVVGVGGMLGVGERKVVVPWSEVKMTSRPDGGKAAVVMDRAKLESAPRYERAARADRAPAASPATSPAAKDTDRDGKRDTTDKAPSDPTKK
jgi:sporulation protein YlmC with PRC-barrel domain